MNDLTFLLMVNHLNIRNNKGFGFLLIKSIKNGVITEVKLMYRLYKTEALSYFKKTWRKLCCVTKKLFLAAKSFYNLAINHTLES